MVPLRLVAGNKLEDCNQTLASTRWECPDCFSVNVGLPRDVAWNGKTVRTSVWESPVTGI
jgi:hypothetical protein